MPFKKVFLLISLILLFDQASKIYIKTHFQLYEDIEVFSWFRLVFVENEGMAWGTRLSDIMPFISPSIAKLSLTIFRILALSGIAYWLYSSVIKKRSRVLIVSIALIFAGALGNIIDSVFYGVIFGDSFGQVAQVFPEDGGYATLFYGKVVDMLHFPFWSGTIPETIPLLGGTYFSFFDPVFNVADMAITTGIGTLLIFNKKAFK
ncbi:MAG: lipoprotein signal peptidase [Bacteroidota bacterium]